MLYETGGGTKESIWRSIRVLEARGRNEELEEARATCRPYEHRSKGSDALSSSVGRIYQDETKRSFGKGPQKIV